MIWIVKARQELYQRYLSSTWLAWSNVLQERVRSKKEAHTLRMSPDWRGGRRRGEVRQTKARGNRDGVGLRANHTHAGGVYQRTRVLVLFRPWVGL